MEIGHVIVFFATTYACFLLGNIDAAEDYYKTLGVGRDATAKDIKKAFRKLALKYHPDKNKEKDAEAKFLKIGKAYEILSDPEKKKKYDLYGDDETNGTGGGGGSFHDFNSFFKDFDEAMNAHRHGQHYHKNSNKGFNHFNFESSDGFFNFDDLFHDMDDDDEDLFSSFHGKANNGFHGSRENHFNFDSFGFDDDFEEFFGGNIHSKYDRFSNEHFAQHSHHHNLHMQNHHNMNFQKQRRQQRCEQVTQRMGNQILTFTQCS